MARVLILAGDAAEDLETMFVKFRLAEAGHEPYVAAPTTRPIKLVVHDFEPDFDTMSAPRSFLPGRCRVRRRRSRLLCGARHTGRSRTRVHPRRSGRQADRRALLRGGQAGGARSVTARRCLLRSVSCAVGARLASRRSLRTSSRRAASTSTVRLSSTGTWSPAGAGATSRTGRGRSSSASTAQPYPRSPRQEHLTLSSRVRQTRLVRSPAFEARQGHGGGSNAKVLAEAPVPGDGRCVPRPRHRPRRHECRCGEPAGSEHRRHRAAPQRRRHEPEAPQQLGDLGEGGEPLAASGRLRAGPSPAGPGPVGPARPAGPAGPAGVSGLERVELTSPSSSAVTRTASMPCPAGKRLLGGGARLNGSILDNVAIQLSYPGDDNTYVARAAEIAGERRELVADGVRDLRRRGLSGA